MEHIKCSITSVCIVLSMDIEPNDKEWRKAKRHKRKKKQNEMKEGCEVKAAKLMEKK